MKKGGNLLRKELSGITYLESHPDIFHMFRDIGCYRFCEKLQGFHQGMAEAFALNFDRAKAKVGTIEVQVDEAVVAAVTEMARTGKYGSSQPLSKILSSGLISNLNTNVSL
jgi:hypothetical protein